VIQNIEHGLDSVYLGGSTLLVWAISPRAATAAKLCSGKERDMREMIETFLVLLRIDRRGVTAVEYAIIAGFVAVVIVLAFTALGTSISTKINAVSSTI